MTVRAAIYARYSSDAQSAASIEDQIRLCKERLASEGWQLVQVYRDAAMSGASDLRPGYQALLEGAREAEFDVVVAEALDRLSRDQADVATLFKRLRFAGIRLVTLAEGEITELHVGLKGTMNALFLKDLADKTRRGLRGRVEAGRSGGGNAYGYRVVAPGALKGDQARGERAIDPAEAAVVRRIFQEYADGAAPRRIAMRLNARGHPRPARRRLGRQRDQRQPRPRHRDPQQRALYRPAGLEPAALHEGPGHRPPPLPRQRPASGLVCTEVPQLRIIPQELWDKVRARQARLDRVGATEPGEPRPFWSQQRPRYLFSGLMRCGACGGGYSKISATAFGCSTARNKGPTACTNRLTIRRDVLEQTVLDGARDTADGPGAVRGVRRRLHRRVEPPAGRDRRRARSARSRARSGCAGRCERLVDAIADGTPPAVVNDRLRDLDARRASWRNRCATAAEAGPAAASQPGGALPPEGGGADGGAGQGRRRRGARADPRPGGSDRADAGGRAPAGRGPRRAGRDFGDWRRRLGTTKAPRVTGALCEQIKMVAGTGFEPVTFRL